MTQSREELEAILRERIPQELSGKRDPYIRISDWFCAITDFVIVLTAAGFVVLVVLVATFA